MSFSFFKHSRGVGTQNGTSDTSTCDTFDPRLPTLDSDTKIDFNAFFDLVRQAVCVLSKMYFYDLILKIHIIIKIIMFFSNVHAFESHCCTHSLFRPSALGPHKYRLCPYLILAPLNRQHMSAFARDFKFLRRFGKSYETTQKPIGVEDHMQNMN